MFKMTDIAKSVDDVRCKFTVSIEGPDRVGKQTQTKLLGAALATHWAFNNVGMIETPIKYGRTYNKIYDMLRDGTAKKYPSAFQGLQVLNRLQYQETFLREFMKEYDAFVFDRWNASSYAYGRASGLSAEEVRCLTELVADVDLTIILDGDPFPKSSLDDYEKDNAMQKRVREYYYEWAKSQPTKGCVYSVNANDTIESVHNAIWDITREWVESKFGSENNVIDMGEFKRRKGIR